LERRPRRFISGNRRRITSAHRKARIIPVSREHVRTEVLLARRDDPLCHLGLKPERCAYEHVAARVPKGREGDKSNRLCPCHDDRKASLSINPGHTHRVVWRCGAECDPGDIRAELLDLGVDESCLGGYGKPKRLIVPGMRVEGYDPALIADAKRVQAIRKLPAGLDGKLYRMCVHAIIEGDGDLPADPLVLLGGGNSDDFYGLADRAGVDPKYKYRLFKQWMANAA